MSVALYPLPPRVRLRIGVSGHRLPPKLPVEAEAPVRALLDRILATIVGAAREREGGYAALAGSSASDPASAATSLADTFVIISSLAEGSDRLLAEAGLAAGFGLEAVLPLARAEYARDFDTPSSRAAFERLLARSAAVFDLNGPADERPRAYEAAGFVMLANVDLLIAIWDGKEAAGVGGTAQIVGRAIADGIPVIWIDPANPSAPQLSLPRAGDLPPANAQCPASGQFSTRRPDSDRARDHRYSLVAGRDRDRPVAATVFDRKGAALEFLPVVSAAGVAVCRARPAAQRLPPSRGARRHQRRNGQAISAFCPMTARNARRLKTSCCRR